MTEAVQFLSSVEQIMRTQVPTVSADHPVSEVRDIIEANSGEPVAVLRPDSTLIGVITSDKLLMDGPSTAGQLTSHPRMTVSPHESAFSVARRMLARRVDWVPVLQNRRFVGIISRRCILAAFGEQQRA